MISNLVNKTWFSRYPCCQYINYDNGKKFKLHFKALCESFEITKREHQVISSIQTAEIDVAPSIVPSDIDTFMTKVARNICST
eukprot:CCRYP_002093-RA/>CCRYP_002093-RA protein AED:0.39 eAED:0.39 QI:0/0/0/1/0/0/2/0/82